MPTGALDDEPTLTARLAQAAAALAVAGDPHAAARALGFDGAMAPTGPVATVGQLDLGGAPIEVWAWRAGVKPVAFLTVAPDRELAVRRAVPDAVVIRRDRRVQVGPQDRWHDDRRRGAPQVELYLAREAAVAERCAELQAADPTRHAGALGQLLGYPPCCVAAFVGQRDRGNNSLNRYLAAARTTAGTPRWPWQLNDLAGRLIPFYPCHYRCPAAVAWADAAVAALAQVVPGAAQRLEGALAATVVYVDHDHQVWLRAPAGDADADADADATDDDLRGISYASVERAGDGPAVATLAAAFAAGDRCVVSAARVDISRGGEPAATLARIGPRLGFLARYG